MPETQNRKPTLMENVQTVNSAVRTVIMLVVAAFVGVGGYTGYKNYVLPGIEAKKIKQDFAELTAQYQEQGTALKELAVQHEELASDHEKLSTAMKLLKVDRRVAHVTVDRKYIDDDGQKILEVSFSELDDAGQVIGSTREFVLKGSKLFVDTWVAKFEDKYIEQADPLRSATLVAFKSVFGDEMKPVDGFPLDDYSKPGIYAETDQSEFEKKIWSDFEKACTDKNLQKDLGIRAIYGQASYVEPEAGQTFEVIVRASGSPSLVPVQNGN